MRNLPHLALASILALSACGPKDKSDTLNLPDETQSSGQEETETVVQAESPPELVFPDEEFRKTQPPPGEIKPFEAPTIQTFKLKNGIEVYLVERHNLPTVSGELTFEGGSINDPRGKEGLASVCVGLMSDGTEKLDKIAFNEALADIASNVSSYAGTDQQGVSFATLTKNLDATLDLWVDSILRPGMREDEFERTIKRRLTALEQAKSSAASVAGRLRESIIYGPRHPYGRFTTELSYGALKLEDCKKYIRDYIKPQGAKLYIVGDITRAEIVDKIEGRLKAWRGKPRRSARLTRPAPRKGKFFFVDIPDAAQSVVWMGHFGPDRKAKDYFANNLMSAILGGGFTSRINMNIREEHGYAYGARGGFTYNRTDGLVYASASVRTDVTVESIQEMVKEIRGIIEGGVTDAELEREIEGAILSLPGSFSTGQQILGTFRSLVYYGLPLDYYDSYVQNVQAVTKEQVNASAKKHLHPEELVFFVVGDARTQLPRIRELAASGAVGKGEVVVLDVDGNVVEEAAGTQ